jgi:HEAT repeat protein
LVKRNAAFALANEGDLAGRDQLVKMLDKEYVDRFTEITPQNRQRYRMAAVVWLGKLNEISVLEKVSREDPDLQVRDAALKQLGKN